MQCIWAHSTLHRRAQYATCAPGATTLNYEGRYYMCAAVIAAVIAAVECIYYVCAALGCLRHHGPLSPVTPHPCYTGSTESARFKYLHTFYHILPPIRVIQAVLEV